MAMKRFVGPKAQLVGLAVLGAVTLGVVAYAVTPPALPEESVTFTPKPLATPTAAPRPAVGSFDAAAEKLRATSEPFTLTVIGDSTGFAEHGWVVTSLVDINRATGRAIALHTWNNTTSQYDAVRLIGNGEPSLTVWNGSASGKDAAYSTRNLETLMPQTPDMLIINHGHNVKMTATIQQLLSEAATKAGPAAAVAVMKQNRETGAAQAAHDTSMTAVAALPASFPGVELIDAYAVTDPAIPNILREDGIHPTAEGYRLWADVFLQRLGFV